MSVSLGEGSPRFFQAYLAYRTARHISITMSLFTEQDHRSFMTDSSLHITTGAGRQQVIRPFQPNQPCHIPMRPPPITASRPPSVAPIPSISTAVMPTALSASANATPVSLSAHAGTSLAHPIWRRLARPLWELAEQDTVLGHPSQHAHRNDTACGGRQQLCNTIASNAHTYISMLGTLVGRHFASIDRP